MRGRSQLRRYVLTGTLLRDDARRKIAAWRRHYNESRPHFALQWKTTVEFARGARQRTPTDETPKPEISSSDRC